MPCGARATAAADAAAAEPGARLLLQRRTPQPPSFDNVPLRHAEPLTCFSVSPRFSLGKPGFSFSTLKSTQVQSATTDLQQQDLVSTSVSTSPAPAVSVDTLPEASEGRLSTSGGGGPDTQRSPGDSSQHGHPVVPGRSRLCSPVVSSSSSSSLCPSGVPSSSTTRTVPQVLCLEDTIAPGGIVEMGPGLRQICCRPFVRPAAPRSSGYGRL